MARLIHESMYDIATFAKEIRHHLREDNDCVVAITSPFEGFGKSTLAYHLGKAIDKMFGIDRNILFFPTRKGMEDLVENLPKYSVIDADEAIRILYKMKWGDKDTIFLNELYSVCRQENLATLLPIPRMQDLVEFFRNHKVKFWVHVVQRGTAVIFFKDDNTFAPDPWHMKENYKIYTKYRPMKQSIFYTLDEKLAAYQRCKNFVGIITFPDLDEETKLIYREKKRTLSYGNLQATDINKMKVMESVEFILKNQIKFIKEYRGKPHADLDRIMIHFGVGRSQAMQIKKVTEDTIVEQLKKDVIEKKEI